MDWDDLIALYDDVTELNKLFTKLELAILASSLSSLEESSAWDTGDFDDIQAKLAEIMNKLDDS